MQIAVASGKGGTGKTTVVVNLAVVAAQSSRIQVLDCDVEEPNCHLFLRPEIRASEQVSVWVPSVDETRCTSCGECGQVCAYHAILPGPKKVLVFPELCHGCGACALLCPEKCISEVQRPIGRVEWGEASLGGRQAEFAHGLLNPGEALASPMVSRVRAKRNPESMTIIDSPPGTSCAMVQSIRGTDLCVLVTEPTPFGLHDLELARDTAVKLGIPVAVVINRCDIGDDRVEAFCRKERLPVLGRIPLDRYMAEACAEGRIPALESPHYASVFLGVYKRIIRTAAVERSVRDG